MDSALICHHYLSPAQRKCAKKAIFLLPVKVKKYRFPALERGFIVPSSSEKFEKLLEVISALREPETGCPWDLKQDLNSLTRFMSEESSEYISAVASGKTNEIADELGDVLLQVVLNAKVAEQENKFDINQVIDNITEKMIRRHPHVFANVDVKDTDEVIKNWDEIKQSEKTQSPLEKLFDIPKSLTGLMEADQIGRKSKKLNFDWDDVSQVIEKVEEELTELKVEINELKEKGESQELQSKIEHEMGDLLFSCVQVSRHLKVNPELALKKCNERFYGRFQIVSKKVAESGISICDTTSENLEKYWKEAKLETK